MATVLHSFVVRLLKFQSLEDVTSDVFKTIFPGSYESGSISKCAMMNTTLWVLIRVDTTLLCSALNDFLSFFPYTFWGQGTCKCLFSLTRRLLVLGTYFIGLLEQWDHGFESSLRVWM